MRSVTGWFLWFPVLALAAAPVAGAAQARVPVLRMGQAVQDVLSAGDPSLLQGEKFRVYRFDGRPDRTYRFSATRAQGTARLQVARPVGVLTEYLADSSPSDTVQLRFRPQTEGAYLVVVLADSVGEFTLRGEELGGVAAVPRPLEIGQMVQDSLTLESALGGEEADFFYDIYTFRARAGQQLAIQTLTPYGAPSVFGRMQDGQFVEILDDSVQLGGAVRIPADGEYAIRVQGQLESSVEYPYTLRVTDLSMRPEPRRVRVGPQTSAVLDPATAFPLDGQGTDEWVVAASRGDRLTIAASSSLFDTYLSVGHVQNGVFHEITSDDDSGDDSNALAILEVPETGDYVVRVRAYSGTPMAGGEYTLRVAEVRAVASPTRRSQPQTRPVAWGDSLRGTLDESDALLDDNSHYDVWTFSATAGQRVTVTLHSTSFDGYLAVGRMEGGAFEELSSNDDYVEGQGGDARVVMVAPETGAFVVRVNTFLAGATGDYVLTLARGR